MAGQKPEKNFLPDFCALKMLLAVFFLTELLAFLLALAADNAELSFLSLFALRSLLCLWISIPSASLLCALKPVLRSWPNGVTGLTAFMLIQIICLSVCFLVIEILPYYRLLPVSVAPENRFGFYARSSGVCALVSVAFLRYLYVLFKWQQQMEAKAAAKLNALQARMRPHFLFNSLNSIASLIRFDPVLAESLLEDLADLIRASMRIDEAVLVRLKEELHLVKLYLHIEQQRLDRRLRVTWQIDELPQDALIPALSLQPLIENAVYYGIEPSLEGGEVVITGKLRFNRLFIQISNPISPEKVSKRISNQIALQNLTARLQGCFDGDSTISCKIESEIYYVTLEIPYQR